MTDAELRQALEAQTSLSPALRSSLGLLREIKRLPVCIVRPAAQWYKTENDAQVEELECFCTQFRGLMFQPPRRVVTDCDGYIDAAARKPRTGS